MKKIVYLIMLIGLSVIAQNNPDKFKNGVETKLIALDTLTTAQRDALTLKASKGYVIFNADTNVLNVHNGTSWGEISGGGGSTTPATVTEINTGTDNTKMVTPLGLAGSQLQTDVTANNAKVSYTDATKVGYISVTQAVDLDDIESKANTALQTADYNNAINRANHTGTQLASTISDFDTEVTNNSSVVANTAKVTNATHTGEVTGATSLNLDKTAISNKSTVTAVGTDYVLIGDTSDTGNLKKSLVSDFSILASSQTFTGTNTFNTGTNATNIISNNTNNTGGAGIQATNSASGGFAIAAQNSVSNGFAIYATAGSGYAIRVDPQTGTGLYAQVSSSGKGIYALGSSTGNNIVSNIGVGGSGFAYVGQNDGVTTFSVNKLGNVIGNTFNGVALLTGGTSTKYLSEDGTYTTPSGGGASISDTAYGAGWNGDTTNGASKNAIYDKIESVIAGVGTGATPISHVFTGGESSYDFGTTITDSHQIAYGTTTSDLVLLQEGVSYSKSGSTVTFIGFTALADDVIIYYPNVAVPTTYDASETTVDASGFSGNLSGTDTDVQTALETIDALSLGGGSGTVTSVAVSGSDGIEVDSGSPITTSGTIALGLNKTNTLTFLNVEDGAEVNDTGAEIVSKIDTELGSTDWQGGGGGGSSTTLEATLTITNPTISGGVSVHEIVAAQGAGKIIMIESFNAFSVGGSAATGNTSITGRYSGLGGNSLANNVIMSAAGGSYTLNGGGTTTGTTGDLTNRAFNIVVNNTTDQSLTVTIFVKIRYVIADTTTGF